MEDQTTLRNSITGKVGRTVVLLVDCLETANGKLFGQGSEGLFLLRLGSLLASGSGGRLLLCSVVAVPRGESVSSYSVAAQTRRQDLEKLALAALSQAHTPGDEGREQSGEWGGPEGQLHTLIAPVVRVAPEKDVASEIRRLAESEKDALVLLPLRPGEQNKHPWLRKALRKPLSYDVAWARSQGLGVGGWGLGAFGPGDGGWGPGDGGRNVQPPTPNPQPPSSIPHPPTPNPFQVGIRVMVAARGGPQAALALELSQHLIDALRAQVTVLHVVQDLPESVRAGEEAPFTEFLSQASGSHLTRRVLDTGQNPAETVSQAAANYDLLVMGAGGEAAHEVGKFTEQVAGSTEAAVMAVKSKVPVGPAIRAARRRARLHVLDPETLSLLVDKWFAENTFHADEFSDLSRLIDIKRKRGTTISLGLPTLNEEGTIGEIIKVLKTGLMDDVPLLDEIVLIDSNSTDGTREIASELGIPVYIHQQVLPEAGEPLQGKGEALWKSLHVLKGDVIAWVDTDIANMHPQFVYGLVGPLLREPRIGYTKGYYHRPIQAGNDLQHEGGGRVTELTVRPLLNLFFPLLSGLVQPLAGEYAGRRKVLEQLPFFSGYGVETGLLIDLLERYGISTIGQVNLEKRVHRNRSLADLSLMAFAIVQVVLTRLEGRARINLLEEVNSSMKLIRFEEDHLSLVVRRVRDAERPPIATIPAYRAAHP